MSDFWLHLVHDVHIRKQPINAADFSEFIPGCRKILAVFQHLDRGALTPVEHVIHTQCALLVANQSPAYINTVALAWLLGVHNPTVLHHALTWSLAEINESSLSPAQAAITLWLFNTPTNGRNVQKVVDNYDNVLNAVTESYVRAALASAKNTTWWSVFHEAVRGYGSMIPICTNTKMPWTATMQREFQHPRYPLSKFQSFIHPTLGSNNCSVLVQHGSETFVALQSENGRSKQIAFFGTNRTGESLIKQVATVDNLMSPPRKVYQSQLKLNEPMYQSFTDAVFDYLLLFCHNKYNPMEIDQRYFVPFIAHYSQIVIHPSPSKVVWTLHSTTYFNVELRNPHVLLLCDTYVNIHNANMWFAVVQQLWDRFHRNGELGDIVEVKLKELLERFVVRRNVSNIITFSICVLQALQQRNVQDHLSLVNVDVPQPKVLKDGGREAQTLMDNMRVAIVNAKANKCGFLVSQCWLSLNYGKGGDHDQLLWNYVEQLMEGFPHPMRIIENGGYFIHACEIQQPTGDEFEQVKQMVATMRAILLGSETDVLEKCRAIFNVALPGAMHQRETTKEKITDATATQTVQFFGKQVAVNESQRQHLHQIETDSSFATRGMYEENNGIANERLLWLMKMFAWAITKEPFRLAVSYQWLGLEITPQDVASLPADELQYINNRMAGIPTARNILGGTHPHPSQPIGGDGGNAAVLLTAMELAIASNHTQRARCMAVMNVLFPSTIETVHPQTTTAQQSVPQTNEAVSNLGQREPTLDEDGGMYNDDSITPDKLLEMMKAYVHKQKTKIGLSHMYILNIWLGMDTFYENAQIKRHVVAMPSAHDILNGVAQSSTVVTTVHHSDVEPGVAGTLDSMRRIITTGVGGPRIVVRDIMRVLLAPIYSLSNSFDDDDETTTHQQIVQRTNNEFATLFPSVQANVGPPLHRDNLRTTMENMLREGKTHNTEAQCTQMKLVARSALQDPMVPHYSKYILNLWLDLNSTNTLLDQVQLDDLRAYVGNHMANIPSAKQILNGKSRKARPFVIESQYPEVNEMFASMRNIIKDKNLTRHVKCSQIMTLLTNRTTQRSHYGKHRDDIPPPQSGQSRNNKSLV